MTSRQLIRLMLKRWYLVLADIGITLAVAAAVMMTNSGVYWTQFSVVVVAPTSDDSPNQLEDSRYALTPLAGAIVAEFNGVHRPLLTASPEATLFGEGERSGVMVRMPNQGNQWQPAYVTPNIEVQVVDSTPSAVALQAHVIAAELSDLLAKRQDALGVVSTMRASMIYSPTDPPVTYISGSQVRTLGAIVLLGSAFTIVSVYWLDRFLSRGRSTRAHEGADSPVGTPNHPMA